MHEALGLGERLRQQQSVVLALFPFAANLSQTVRTQFELLAQAMQQLTRWAIIASLDFRRDAIGPFSMTAVINECIGRLIRLHSTQTLRIHAGPKKCEVADVAMHFATRQSDPLFRFAKHLKHFRRGCTVRSTDTVKRIQADAPHQHVAKIVDQLNVRDAQLRLKDVLTQSAKKAFNRVSLRLLVIDDYQAASIPPQVMQTEGRNP